VVTGGQGRLNVQLMLTHPDLRARPDGRRGLAGAQQPEGVRRRSGTLAVGDGAVAWMNN
jgi:hypothetical protein